MPLYPCHIGSVSSGGDTILAVQYVNAFRGQTITATNGAETLTKTAPSDKNEVKFYPTTAGTWTISATISGTTYSTTATVVLNTTTIATLDTYITINVTMYGASGATITWTNADSSSGIATLTGSSASSVPIKIDPAGSTITFEDTTVSKNPSNLSANYTKNVNLSANTTEVYVMPDNCLYWYGYSNNLENCSVANGWAAFSSSGSWATPTWNTNEITLTTTSSTFGGVGSTSAVSGVSKWHSIYKNSASSSNGRMEVATTKSGNTDRVNIDIKATSTTHAELNDTYGSSTRIFWTRNMKVANTMTIYAIWYE